MKKIKSAFEIAMEKASEIDDQLTPEEEVLLKQEKAKPLLAKFYKDRLDADELWQKLEEVDDLELYEQAQILLLDSIGLKTPPEQVKRRKEGILAIESLKGGVNTSFIEQSIEQVLDLQNSYKAERGKYQKIYEDAMENAEMSIKPIRTKEGKTVMQLQQSLDEETEKRLKSAISQLEEQSNEMLKKLLNNIKKTILS